MTSRAPPLGSDPPKYISLDYQGQSGSLVGWAVHFKKQMWWFDRPGSSWFFFQHLFVKLREPDFCLKSCLHFTSPWCLSCVISATFCRRVPMSGVSSAFGVSSRPIVASHLPSRRALWRYSLRSGSLVRCLPFCIHLTSVSNCWSCFVACCTIDNVTASGRSSVTVLLMQSSSPHIHVSPNLQDSRWSSLKEEKARAEETGSRIVCFCLKDISLCIEIPNL